MVLGGHSVEAEPSAERITKVQTVVLDLIARLGPLTDDQLEALYQARAEAYPEVPSASPQSIRSRRAELARRGRVAADPVPGTSKYGRRCTRWTLA